MKKIAVLGLFSLLGACAKTGPGPQAPVTAASTPDQPVAVDGRPGDGLEPADRRPSEAAWIGASGEGDLLASNTRDTTLGVWVDVPSAHPSTRPAMDVILVVDTSGSMAGAKIQNARSTATALLDKLHDGDMVALDAFSDSARTIVPPTRLDAQSRSEIRRKIAELRPAGSTNMFEGLSLAETQMASAHDPLRRIVVISDGIANIGPSSPESLGAIAERGLRFRAQVTSLGIGNDYDERTLNALSVRSSGRLYHLTDPTEMASILKGELDLLDATLASEADVEVVPAPGVQVLGVDGVRADRGPGGLVRIPLGALHAGQHKEALVRVRLTDPAAFEGHSRSLASVRLRFRDAQDSDVERIQEVVARVALTGDTDAVARSKNPRTQAIVALQDVSKVELDAVQHVNDGRFVDADREMAAAEDRLRMQARSVTTAPEKKRLEAAASQLSVARKITAAAPSKPKAEQRDDALKLNAGAMHQLGY